MLRKILFVVPLFICTIVLAQTSTITITNPTLNLQAGVYTLAFFPASGGTTPYYYSATGIPPGMTFDDSELFGTPTEAGTFSVTIQVTDAMGNNYSESVIMTVAPASPIKVSPPGGSATGGTSANPYTLTSHYKTPDSLQLQVSGGSGSYTYTASGLPSGWILNSTTGLVSCALPIAETGMTYTTHPGGYCQFSYSVTVTDNSTGATGKSYFFMYIDPLSLTLTVNSVSRPYGSPNPVFDVTFNGFATGDDSSMIGTIGYYTSASSTTPVGVYEVDALTSYGLSPGMHKPYLITNNPGNLTITPVPLTISSNDTMTYGSAVPALPVVYSGFVNGDNVSSLSSPAIASTTATSASGVGQYPITVGGAADSNYSITYRPSTLAIEKTIVTVTASNQTITYGSTAVGLITLSYSGFVNGQNVSVLGISHEPGVRAVLPPNAPVGNYPIVPSGGSSPNYTFNYINGTLTVVSANLTITANNTSSTYGSPLVTNPGVSYSGFVNGDGVASLTTPATVTNAAYTGAPAGTYALTTSGAADSNYTIQYTNGTYTINPATLTATATDETMTYGGTVPALPVTYSGFVNNDDSSSLSAAAITSTTATSGSSAGTYPITVSGANDSNYTINYISGTLTVTPDTLTVSATDVTKTYGDVTPILPLTFSGFVNGDDIGSLGFATAVTPASHYSPVGTYPINPGGGSDANYTIVYVPGTLTITPATVMVTATNETMLYGDTLPALAVTYSGFVGRDNASSLTTATTVTASATLASPVGTYPIIPSGAVDSNYIFTYVNGTLTIDPAALTVTANAETKVYGTPDPQLSYSVTGLVNGDDTTIFSGSLSRDAGENAGTYPITEGTLSVGGNYIMSFTGNNLVITRAPQVISWTESLLFGCGSTTPIQLTAAADSGSTISYTSSNPDVATVSGNVLTPVQPGTTVIAASLPGDANHLPATNVADTATYQSSSLVRQHWGDVLFFDNSSDQYDQWQWYKNGSAIPGATGQYYTETPVLNGQYYVIATNSAGGTIQTCPLSITGSSGTAAGSLQVYPNPVASGGSVTVVSTYAATALQGAMMQIVDMSGKVWQQITTVQPSMKVTMPAGAGMYTISLQLTNGQKATVNVLVK